MKNKYLYLISYSFRGGVGCCRRELNSPITSCLDLNKLIKEIETTNNVENVGIETYQLISKKMFNRKFIK